MNPALSTSAVLTSAASTRAIVFAYSEVGVRCLNELLQQGVQIPLLFTHPDDARETQWFASVQDAAAAHGIEAVMPESPNTPEWIERGQSIAPDFVFSFYYRHLLAEAWLEIPRRGALNMHGSLLPKYRGRAPVHWAIIHGETVTGASLHYMLQKPDAGALVDQEAVPIGADDDALAVSMNVADAAQRLLRRSLPRLIAGTAAATPLDLAQGSYFGRRRPEDGRIDWRCGARQIHDLVRAVAPPFPGAFTEVNGVTLALWQTQLAPGPLRHPDRAPCLYQEQGAWFADCVDGQRLKITRLAVDGTPLAPNTEPAAFKDQPLALR